MNRLGNGLRLTGALYLAGIFLFACSGLALAQISEYDLAPPRSSLIQPPPPPADHPVTGASAWPGNAHRAERSDPGAIAPAGANSSRGLQFSYTVRSGDTLSSIAEAFGLATQSLARANRISSDTMLIPGKVLKVPNPFAAKVSLLDAQISELKAETAAAGEKASSADLKIRGLGEQIQSLTTANESLKHGLKSLPWWRGLAWSAFIAALLLLGITLLTLFEWWVLRRRFNVLARMSESLSRLDNKYKALLAKA
ncbi:MAG: LysM peptidoglycan-binding domain-containing protein, partial [Candidatus Binataceae bacterium]